MTTEFQDRARRDLARQYRQSATERFLPKRSPGRSSGHRACKRQGPDAYLAATFACWENFTGIEKSFGIERIADAAHQIELNFAEEQRHQMVFLHPDAMLAGDGSAHLNAKSNDFAGRCDDAFEFIFIPSVEQYNRMQVAVAGVKNVADFESVLSANFGDAAQRCGQFGAWNHAILHVICGANSADCAKGILAAFPQ